MHPIFGNLRRENVQNIFMAATDRNRISRSDIAGATGISLMTVGKVVDALHRLHILQQTAAPDKTPGRRSRVVSVSEQYRIAVFDLSHEKYVAHACDLTGRILASYSYPIDPEYYPDDNLQIFFRRGCHALRDVVNVDNCCGCGILTPGSYDSAADLITDFQGSRFFGLAIRKTFAGFALGALPTYIGDARRYAAAGLLHPNLPQEAVMCVFLGKAQLSGCYFRTGDAPMDLRFTNLGNVGAGGGQTLANRIYDYGLPELLRALSDTLCWTTSVVPVDRIVIAGDLYHSMTTLAALVKEQLWQAGAAGLAASPEVIPYDDSTAAIRGIVSEIKEAWFAERFLAE